MEVVKADLGWHVPPPNSAIIGITRKDTVVDYSKPIDWHHVTNEHPQLLQTFIVDLVQSNPVICTSQQQFIADYFSKDHGNTIPPDLLLVPVQDRLLLVSSYQDVMQNCTEHYRMFMVTVVHHHHRHWFALEQDAAGTATNEDRRGVQADVANRTAEGPKRTSHCIRRRNDPDSAD